MHPPYVALYPSDFLADITSLGNTELGIYWRLLLVYYQTREPLPQDRDKLIRTAMAFIPEEIRALDYVLEQFFVAGLHGPDKTRVYRHARADREIEAASTRWNAAHERAVNAAKTRWNAQAMLKHKHKQSLSNANQNQNLITTKNPYVEQARRILDFLNERTGKHFRPVKANLDLITNRLKDGASPEDCQSVVTLKAREWKHDPDMVDYLRPATLFNATKFAQYLGEIPNVAKNETLR